MRRLILVGALFLGATSALTNCAVETNVDIYGDAGVNPNVKPDASTADAEIPDAGSDAEVADSATPTPTECHPAVSGEAIPARSVTHADATLPTKRRAFVDDMFSLFRALCGACHVDGNQGNWQVGRLTFNAEFARQSILSMKRTNIDPKAGPSVMPPASVGGKLPQDRTADDPSNELLRMLSAYLAAGAPRYSYEEEVPVTLAEDGTDSRLNSPYRFTAEMAAAFTSLGDCIPDKGLFATEGDEMLAMDDKLLSLVPKATGTLAERIGLPPRLQDTDLFTFDSKELAKRGVIAWAPNYPQFNDKARAIRHIRLPKGEPIQFDKLTQQFTFPEGTRFYKTFLKPVVEADGSLHWKKIETRLIIAWSDDPSLTGFRAVTSVFGTYAWNEDETQANLVTDPQRNGDPFRDRVLTYVSDEVLAKTVYDKNLKDPGYTLTDVGALHHYAIPGGRRCVECHQGSPSKNGVIGFQPLQIKRRPLNQGGVREAPGADELTQVKRLIDYGMIAGLTSEDELQNLEDSQGDRKPRNDHELDAQALFIPACANCHSPRGAATEYNPELATLLDFQPSATGGIFQFPLDRFSPRIVRGGAEKIPIPYITPSLFDLPVPLESPRRGGVPIYWRPKCNEVERERDFYDAAMSRTTVSVYYAAEQCVLAPWRSLIYRGVDAPFAYSDDLALFPRMPVHTPGFDCQASQVVGKWMVSIPAVLADPRNVEYIVAETGQNLSADPGFEAYVAHAVTFAPQPYREVKPGDADYGTGVAGAEQRLAEYMGDEKAVYSGYNRYAFCPGNADIIDKDVLKNPTVKPVPTDVHQPGTGLEHVNAMRQDNVPDNVHWVVLDQTEVPGDWYPRRGDWQDILLTGKTVPTQAHEKLVVSVLKDVTLTSNMKAFAISERPMTLWQEKPGCDFKGQLTVASYKSRRPAWMAKAAPDVNSSKPVYHAAPGEFVYDQVCAHCHGVLANSSGREASTLTEMTGGSATVTNFRTGIGLQSARFGVFPFTEMASPDDWAARYFSWMGLGGTTQKIPQSIIAVVSTTDVLGRPRPKYKPPTDANMLSSPEDLCSWVMPAYSGKYDQGELGQVKPSGSPVVTLNGDAELWFELCALDNPRPVRVMVPDVYNSDKLVNGVTLNPYGGYYRRDKYPMDAPVVDHLGKVVRGISATNQTPWCVRKPADADAVGWTDQWLQKNLSADGATPYPYCPTADAEGNPYISSTAAGSPYLSQEEVDRWKIRGAINAGNAAFIHVMNLTKGMTPSPAYNECELLNK